MPTLLEQAAQGEWSWQLDARDTVSGAQDSLALSLRLLPAVPLGVQQAALVQIDGHWMQQLEWPREALPRQGGVRLTFSDKLADPVQGVPGLRDWWAAYPYVCLEQTVGKAIGLGIWRCGSAPWLRCPPIWTMTGWPCTSRRSVRIRRGVATVSPPTCWQWIAVCSP